MTDDAEEIPKLSFKDLKNDYAKSGWLLGFFICLILFAATYVSFFVFNDYKFFKFIGVICLLFSIVYFLYFIRPVFSRIIIPLLIVLIQIISVFTTGILKYIHKELTKE